MNTSSVFIFYKIKYYYGNTSILIYYIVILTKYKYRDIVLLQYIYNIYHNANKYK